MRDNSRLIQAALADLIGVIGLLESFIWGWRGSFRLDGVVLGTALLLLSVYIHRVRTDSVRNIVAAPGSAVPALRSILIFAIPAYVVILLIFILKPNELPSAHKMAARWVGFAAFGLVQEYLLLAHIYRSSLDLVHRQVTAMIITATLFSALHWPNTFLMAVTALAGLASCWIYDRARNILALGLAHGTFSWALYYGLPRAVTEGLRIGPQLHQ